MAWLSVFILLSLLGKRYGLSYLLAIGLPSLISCANNHKIPGKTAWSHGYKSYEMRANRNASSYFGKNYGVSWATFEADYPTHL